MMEEIWEQTQKNHIAFLKDLPDYGGAKNGRHGDLWRASAMWGNLMTKRIMPPDTILRSARMQILPKPMICSTFFQFFVIRTFSALEKFMGSESDAVPAGTGSVVITALSGAITQWQKSMYLNMTRWDSLSAEEGTV